MTTAHARFHCRSCHTDSVRSFVDLGAMPSANAYRRPDASAPEVSFPLRTVVCDTCRLVQLDYDVPPADLFSDYAYFSSYSSSWVDHARIFCHQAARRWSLGAHSRVVELASNDGYLLKHFVALGIPVLGIEPAANVAEVAVAAGIPTETRFFGRQTAKDLAAQGISADLVVGNNVLAHVPDLNDFIGGLPVLLKPGGVFSFEFPHLLQLLRHVQFDTIYHEHFSYFSLLAVEVAMRRHGLRLFDAEELPTHGGSLRIWGARLGEHPGENGAGLRKVRADEASAGLERAETYEGFAHKVAACRASLLAFLAEARQRSQTVVGYGAAAKGNTLLNYCGVTPGQIAYVVDRNPHKQNHLLPGSHIPICDPQRIFETKPDYLLILPWNLKTEIMAQMEAIRAWGGRFVTPVPLTEITP